VIPDATTAGTFDREKAARVAMALALCGALALACWFLAAQGGRGGGGQLTPAERRDLWAKADAVEGKRWAEEEREHNSRVKEARYLKEEEYRKKYPVWARACQSYVLDRLSKLPATDVFTRQATAVQLVKEFETANPMPLSPHEEQVRRSTGARPATEWPLRPLPP
jgi:hypothetical protein